jgi:MarR family 2-MHQ and catechol resistance regulon transcriptional repressor
VARVANLRPIVTRFRRARYLGIENLFIKGIHPMKRIDGTRLWTVLARCYRALEEHADRSISGTGLCLSDFTALEALLHKGPLTIGQIQEKVLLTSGSMTAAIDRLEKLGCVTREPAAGDRRARLVRLTVGGQKLIHSAYRRHAKDMEAAIGVLNDEERGQLYGLTKKLGLFAAGKGEKPS